MIAVGVTVSCIEQFKGNLRQIFSGRHAVKNDCLVIRHRIQEIHNGLVTSENEERVIPQINHMLLGEILDLRKIHHHAIGGITSLVDNVTGERDFDGVAVAMQVATLTFMVRDAVACIEFKTAGDQHEVSSN